MAVRTTDRKTRRRRQGGVIALLPCFAASVQFPSRRPLRKIPEAACGWRETVLSVDRGDRPHYLAIYGGKLTTYRPPST